MKKIGLILTALLIAFVSTSSAADVAVKWDPNDPAPEGYRVFAREIDHEYDYSAPVWEGAETSGGVSDLVPGTRYAFVVRAYAGELESADSDEVVYTIPTEQQQIIYPDRPKNILIVFE